MPSVQNTWPDVIPNALLGQFVLAWSETHMSHVYRQTENSSQTYRSGALRIGLRIRKYVLGRSLGPRAFKLKGLLSLKALGLLKKEFETLYARVSQ